MNIKSIKGRELSDISNLSPSEKIKKSALVRGSDSNQERIKEGHGPTQTVKFHVENNYVQKLPT